MGQDYKERLKESARNAAAKRFDAGRESGEAWAKEVAEASELGRLKEIFADKDRWAGLMDSGREAFRLSDRMAEAILEPDSYGELRGAGTHIAGDDDCESGIADKPTYWLGFAEGALAVWKEVEQEVTAAAGIN